MDKGVKRTCPSCNKLRHPDEFGWSRHRRRPTKTCKHCWRLPSTMGGPATAELILYYADIRSLMEDINKARAEHASTGGPEEDTPVESESLGEVFFGVLTGEAYKRILEALVRKAEQGDVRAAEMLMTERHRRLGEPTPGSVEDSYELLLNIDPLTPNMDTE